MLAVAIVSFMCGAGAALLSLASILRIVEDRELRRREREGIMPPATAWPADELAEQRRRVETTAIYGGDRG